MISYVRRSMGKYSSCLSSTLVNHTIQMDMKELLAFRRRNNRSTPGRQCCTILYSIIRRIKEACHDTIKNGNGMIFDHSAVSRPAYIIELSKDPSDSSILYPFPPGVLLPNMLSLPLLWNLVALNYV